MRLHICTFIAFSLYLCTNANLANAKVIDGKLQTQSFNENYDNLLVKVNMLATIKKKYLQRITVFML